MGTLSEATWQTRRPADGAPTAQAASANAATDDGSDASTPAWTSTGGRRRVTVSDMDEDRCKAKLRKKMREVMADDVAALAPTKTVKQWADEWLPMHRQSVRPNVFVTNRGHVMKWIVPTIGTRKLAELSPADARKIETAITSAGCSTSTARGAISVLRTMLKSARIEGYRIPDGILEMERPKLARSDRDAIPNSQAKALLRKADGTPDLARWMLALYQALRDVEGAVLKVDAIPLQAEHLTGAFHLVRPKTGKGKRMVPLSPMAWATLKAWKDVAPANPWGLVFTLPERRRNHGEGPRPRHKDRDRERWYDLQRAAGVKRPDGTLYTLHEARHTTASLLLEAGVDPHTVTSIMGHSSILTSRGYQHVAIELARKALTDVGAMLDYKVDDTKQIETKETS